jgi:hypothetical protein
VGKDHLNQTVSAAANQLAAHGLSFLARRRFGGRLGSFLVYELPADEQSRALTSHRSCRILEIVTGSTAGSSTDGLSFDSDSRFALEIRDDKTDLQNLVEQLLAGGEFLPSPIVHVPVPRPPLFDAELADAWRQTRARVADFADGLGRQVDRGIRETVAALLINGFPTKMSCEGHLGRGERTPWVTVGWGEQRFAHDDPAPNVIRRRQAAANRTLAKRLKQLVSDFNATRPALPAWQRLIVAEPTPWLSASIEFYGGCRLYDHSWTERELLLSELRREMTAFARFLRHDLAETDGYYYLWG